MANNFEVLAQKLDLIARYTEMPLYWGQVTSGRTDKLIDQMANWESNIWAGYEIVFVAGAGAGQVRIIKSNNLNSIVPRFDWSVVPDATTVYVIRTARGIVPNRSAWTHGHKDVPIAGTAVQLPNVKVPDGFALVLKAKVDNNSYIYYGNSKENAENSPPRCTLAPSESIALSVTNANLLWINAAVDGDGVEYIVEQ